MLGTNDSDNSPTMAPLEMQLKAAKADARAWMTKYQIELDLVKQEEKRAAQLQSALNDVRDRNAKLERKCRVLSNCLATLIDSEEF